MQIELSRATFRRLVQLYLITLILELAVIGLETVSISWQEFSDRFDVLVSETFGPSGPSDSMLIPAIVVLVSIAVWMLASSIGLLWYRRWARFGVWASTIAMYGGLLIVEGYRPTYSSPALDMLATLDGMLLGSIVLVAYAKNYGADWFAAAPTNKQE